MTMPILLPEGFRDRLPPQAEASARLERIVLDRLTEHGYARVAPSLAEFEEGMVAGLGAAVSENLLRVTDPISQRTLVLRSDMTGQVGRIATTRLAGTPRPLRLCYAGEVLQLRAGQLRPERSRRQIGAELIGSDTVAAASEIASVALAALTAAGVGGLTIDFTLPDALDMFAADSVDPDRLEAIRTELDMKDAGALRAMGADAYLPLIEAAGPIDDALAALRAFDTDGILASRIDGLAAIAGHLPAGVRKTLDPTERHGFAYQSWFGFTLYADDFVGSLGRGGAYAVQRADGSAEEAVGFSLYPDPLIDAGFGVKDKRRLFLPLGHDRAHADGLRQAGWITVAALSDADDGQALGCTHRLADGEPLPY